jgi:hypothetical protein
MALLLNSKYVIRNLFHFTDIRNIPSIKKHGLLSLSELQTRGIEILAPGGNEWSHEEDERRGLDEYVHLCFFDQHPMEYQARQGNRIGETRFLKISPDLLRDTNVRFTDGVANRSGSKLLTIEEALTMLDFEVIGTRTNWRDAQVQLRLKAAKKYEILVPKSVSLNSIFFS